MKRRTIHTNAFVDDATNIILACARFALAERGSFRLSLCGGNTPRPVYAQIAADGKELPWEKIIVTFGDERCVPPEHEESNYRMARLSLLDEVPIPQQNILRMRGEIQPELAADEYELALKERCEPGEQIFMHDLLLLGIGDDGHTASLFPETEALNESERDVVANFVPKLQSHRITFTFPLINAARHVLFLVDKPAKREVVEQILRGHPHYPAAHVKPVDGELTWLLGF